MFIGQNARFEGNPQDELSGNHFGHKDHVDNFRSNLFQERQLRNEKPCGSGCVAKNGSVSESQVGQGRKRSHTGRKDIDEPLTRPSPCARAGYLLGLRSCLSFCRQVYHSCDMKSSANTKENGGYQQSRLQHNNPLRHGIVLEDASPSDCLSNRSRDADVSHIVDSAGATIGLLCTSDIREHDALF